MTRGGRRAALASLLIVFAVGCDDGAGCDDVLTELDDPLPSYEFFDEAAVARISPAGVGFVEDTLSPIVQDFASADCGEVWCPEGWGTCNGASECRGNDPDRAFVGVKVPSMTIPEDESPTGLNDIRICEPDEDPAFEDCNVYVRVDNVDIDPSATSSDLGLTADVTVWSSKVIVYVDYNWPLGSSTCDMYIRQADSPSNAVNKTITADVDFDSNNSLDRLAVKPSNIDISFDADDLYIENCILEYDFIKDLVFGFVEDTLKERIDSVLNETLEGMLSESCADAPCSRPDVSYCAIDDLCRFDSDGTAVPRLLGLEGNLALDALLGGFAGRSQNMEFSAFANGGGTSNGGLNLEMKAAAVAETSDCVPYSPTPTAEPPTFAPPGSGYHVAVGASDRLLNTMLHEAYRSGVLCQSLSGNDLAALNSGAVSLLVPSLSSLTGGETVPLTIDVLPRTPPELQIGANVTGPDPDDPDVTQLIEPLLTLSIEDLDLDLYAEREGGLFRALTLRVDLAVDLSLAIGGNGELILVAGDSSRWLQELEVLNGDVLAESPEDIEEAVPVLLGVVLPLLTDSLDQTFPLPAFSGFSLNLDEVTGSQSYGETAYGHTRYGHLALYADLSYDPDDLDALAPARAETVAELTEVIVPELDAIRAGEKVKVRIAADVLGRDPAGPAPVLWSRVDDGFWRPLVEGTALAVTDPVLHLEGFHTIEVAAARPGQPRSLDATPAEIEVLVDYLAPELSVTPDPAGGLRVEASDTVAGPGELVVQLVVDGLPRGEVALDEAGVGHIAADPSQHRIEITATDLAGRATTVVKGQAPIRHGDSGEGSLAAAHPELDPRADQPAGVVDEGGCASTKARGPLWALLGLFGLLSLRPRRRR